MGEEAMKTILVFACPKCNHELEQTGIGRVCDPCGYLEGP